MKFVRSAFSERIEMIYRTWQWLVNQVSTEKHNIEIVYGKVLHLNSRNHEAWNIVYPERRNVHNRSGDERQQKITNINKVECEKEKKRWHFFLYQHFSCFRRGEKGVELLGRRNFSYFVIYERAGHCCAIGFWFCRSCWKIRLLQRVYRCPAALDCSHS